MSYLGIGGNIETIAFHAWDGFFKILLFVLYIQAISFIPEIKEVFQYHGAEHKVISCYENSSIVSAKNAKLCTRLHPRCGTSFILFVLLIAIIIHSIFVPVFLFFPLFENNGIKHLVVLLIKILLIIPISAIAYEVIRFSSRTHNSWILKILTLPGLALQILSTKEPSIEQLEVAVIALKVALGENDTHVFETEAYTLITE